MKVREILKRVTKHAYTREFVKFAIVGVANTAIHLAVLFILTHYFSVYYMISSFIAFLVAVTNSFILNTTWTFRKNIRDKVTVKYSKFFIVSAVAAVSNLTFLYIFTEYLGVHYLVSQLIAIVLTLMINFIGNKFWTYN
jgi:putative flippase GtrA